MSGFEPGREVVSALVTRQAASYRDLDEAVSCEDALHILWALETRDYNEWIYSEAVRKEAENG